MPGQIASQSSSSGQVTLAIAQATAFSGPLPPPSILAEYDHIHPGLADRIVKMAEGQASHRQSLEQQNLRSNIVRSYMGLSAGTLIGMTGLVGGCVVIIMGHSFTQHLAGGCLGGTGLALLVKAFLDASHARKEELAVKAKAATALAVKE